MGIRERELIGDSRFVDRDFNVNGHYYPDSEAIKLILYYSSDDINKVQEFKVEPFNEGAYETIIKPKLLSIIAEFDNIK